MALPVPLASGDQVYKFTIQDRIGGGSFGEVWLAHDQTIKKDVAIKFLDASHVSIDDLLKEAVVGHRAGHANLVTVHYADVLKYNGANLVAVAMDYFPNGSILKRVTPGNFVPIQLAVKQVIDILRGLEYLHELGTLHNDIKPQNILIGPNGEGVLTDYGISEVTSAGTPAKPSASYKLHKAPEVVSKGEIDVLTDIYQVGMTMFRLINGIGLVRDKFRMLGEMQFRARAAAGTLIRNTDYQPFVPNAVRRIVAKAIDADSGQRYQSALEMRRALEKLSLAGSWSVDPTGQYVGEDNARTYRVITEPMRGARFRFTTFQTLRKSGKEMRFGKFSGTGLTQAEVERLKRKAMCAVVEGKT